MKTISEFAMQSTFTATNRPRGGQSQCVLSLSRTLTALLLLVSPASLLAGTFKLPPGSADPGSSVTVSFKDKSGGDESKTMPAGADGSASITFDAKTEKGATGATISFSKNGKPVAVGVKIPGASADGFNQYEPFKIPEFFAVNPEGPLSDNIDLVAFLSSGADINVGDLLQVTDGSISQTSSITFGDFTGTVEAYGIIDVEHPTPEPGSLLLLGSGVIGLSGLLRKRLRR